MHRSSNHPGRWLAATAGILALAAFPAAAAAAPPVNTVPPAITIPSGGAANEITNPSEGRTLTSTPGTWNPAQTTYHYQWTQDCSAPGAVPVNLGTAIPAATNATYKIANSDIGHMLCLTVSTGGSAAVLSSNETGVVTAGTPLDRAAPTMSGTTGDGQTLTANPGTWDGTAPISFTYAWRRCDSAGKNCGATFTGPSSSPTYVLQDADVGHTMSVVVTAMNSAGTVQLGSFATNTVVAPSNTGRPSISGTPQAGDTLSESHGSWLPSSSTLAYQWEACDASGTACATIPGATSQTYTLTSANVGHTMVVEESATQNGAGSTPAASAATGVVQAAPAAAGGSGGNPSGGSGGNPGGGSGGNAGSGSGGIPTGGQPAPTGGAPSPGVVNAAQLRVRLGGALRVHGHAARIGALLKRGGYSFTFSAPTAGRLTITWYRVQRGRGTVIATVNVLLHRTGPAKLELVLTRSGRNLLKRAGTMTLAAHAGFTPAGLGTTTASRTIKLIR